MKGLKEKWLVLIFVLVLVLGFSSQVFAANNGIFELLGYRLPADGDASMDADFGDVDGDGDMDIIIANSKQNRLYLNDGTGSFTDATSTGLPANSDNSRDADFGDVDGDGDMDIIIANYFQQNRLYLNDGTGSFTDATSTNLPADSDNSWDADFGDVDGDGDMDIIIANYFQQNRLYLNDGTGVFTDAASTNLPVDSNYSFDADFGDVDGDGDLDIIIANSQQNRLYLNDGTGSFTDATSTNLPADSDSSWNADFGDVDGDGDLDIIIANHFYQQNRLYLNDGTGVFTDATSTNLPADSDYSYDADFGDVDGDGDLDIIIANHNRQNRLYLNDGTGSFTDATSTNLPADSISSEDADFGDVDGDGDLDIIIANCCRQNRLYLNDGTGVFTDATSSNLNLPAASDDSMDADFGDVDGDGDLDIIIINTNSQQNRLYLNDGTGVFTDATSTNLPADSDGSMDADFGDVDGDGDLDIIIANYNQNRLYLNDGTGVFTDATSTNLPADSDYSRDADFGDVDADGDLDIIIANYHQNRLYLNDGTGVFTDATSTNLPANSDSSMEDADFGDVDGDGDLDIIIANSCRQNRLYLNDGTGLFTDATSTNLPADSDSSYDADFGDVDGDGDLDIIIANYNHQNRLYLNDGTGVFTDATSTNLPADIDGSVDADFGDVDGDGDLDIIIANSYRPIRLYLNDGTGVFTDATSTNLPAASDDSMDADFGDVDGDGDLDIIIANGDQNRLYTNTEISPEEQVVEILATFDDAIEAGDLVGDGPGESADNLLNALRNMILTAGDLIEAGDIAGACEQLLDAYRKTDGLGPPDSPPDLVTGEAADDLAAMILDLMTILGCG